MVDKLKEILKNSYAPYSNYHVAALLITNDNNEISGVNVENASYGATICAERVALTKAISMGYKKNDFKEIHILGSSETKAYPCFMCRQVFVELLNKDTKVYIYNQKGNVETYKVGDLCPLPFGEN